MCRESSYEAISRGLFETTNAHLDIVPQLMNFTDSTDTYEHELVLINMPLVGTDISFCSSGGTHSGGTNNLAING